MRPLLSSCVLLAITTIFAPSLVQSTNEGPSCVCDYNQTWLDVMVLLDISTRSGQDGVDYMMSYVKTMFAPFTIERAGTSNQFHTRMGFITYSNNATVDFPLGTLNGNLLYSLDVSADGGNDTNLNAALLLAMNEFKLSNHRPNAQRVILVLAESYNRMGSTVNPYQTSTDFKNSHGIIAVLDYLPNGKFQDGTLNTMATSGYYVPSAASVHIDPVAVMRVNMCNANCFCPKGYQGYQHDLDGNPMSGCYLAYKQPATNSAALAQCKVKYSGYLAQGKTADKTIFLEGEFLSTNVLQFWAGMSWDSIKNDWFWNDGTRVDGTYHPWSSSLSHTNGKDCVAVVKNGNNVQWVQNDCRSSYSYICEQNPCDSTHYCPDPLN